MVRSATAKEVLLRSVGRIRLRYQLPFTCRRRTAGNSSVKEFLRSYLVIVRRFDLRDLCQHTSLELFRRTDNTLQARH